MTKRNRRSRSRFNCNKRHRKHKFPSDGSRKLGSDQQREKMSIFQDLACDLLHPSHQSLKNKDGFINENTPSEGFLTDAASIFFELANTPLVGYRVVQDGNAQTCLNTEKMLVIRQDNDCSIHTGGIVWETSYLLAEFLSARFDFQCNNKNHPLGKTLEIGAGCGMLGLILATKGLSSKVILTEAAEVMGILTTNVLENVDSTQIGEKESEELNDDSTHHTGVHGTDCKPACPAQRISVRQLRWDNLEHDITAALKGNNLLESERDRGSRSEFLLHSDNDLEPHTFDTIVGTDVVFSPALVRPMLDTLRRMSHKPRRQEERMKKTDKGETRSKIDSESSSNQKSTQIFLCLQIRCPDSHALLFAEAPNYGFEVIDITTDLSDPTGNGCNTYCCSWGSELECVLLKMNCL